jgi:hypothetical protein
VYRFVEELAVAYLVTKLLVTLISDKIYVVEAVCYKSEGLRVRILMGSFFFSIYLILPAVLWPWGLLGL